MQGRDKQTIGTIQVRTAYEAGRRILKTPESAAKSLAWHMILEKYGQGKNGETVKVEEIQQILEMKCECGGESEYSRPFDSCQIHDCYNGYFKNLHRRLVKVILKRNGFS